MCIRDSEYTAAKYEGDQLVTNPRVTILHNGVLVHDDVELPGERSTTSAPNKPGPEPGPIYLQDHGNPLRYRNIWVVAVSYTHLDVYKRQALHRRENEEGVFVIENGTAHWKAVTLGVRGRESVEVLEGLSESDVVLLVPTGQTVLTEGRRVRTP